MKTNKVISFKATKEEHQLFVQIASRAANMAQENGLDYPHLDAVMDVNVCHSNGNPLRLSALLNADDFNFSHDVFGIRRHINRRTGELENCFSPRFSI